MGFRYVELENWPGEPDPEAFRGVIIHSELEPTGRFECSDPLLNRLQANIVWGQKVNFVDVPTDCPQRDERLGWTGDAQVFIRTATINRDVAAFFTKWLRDLAAEQAVSGGIVPMIVPALPKLVPAIPFAGWGDAAVVVPWVIYERTGDSSVLADQFDSMKIGRAHV